MFSFAMNEAEKKSDKEIFFKRSCVSVKSEYIPERSINVCNGQAQDMQIKLKLSARNCTLNGKCNYRILILADGHEIDAFYFNPNNNISQVLTINTNDFVNIDFGAIATPHYIDFQVILEQTCYEVINTSSPPVEVVRTSSLYSSQIPVVNDGEDYHVITLLQRAAKLQKICDPNSELYETTRLCCTKAKTLIRYDQVNKEISTSQITGKVTLKVTGGFSWKPGENSNWIGASSGVNLSLEGSAIVSHLWTEESIQLVRTDVPITGPEGKCQYFGYQIYGDLYRIDFFRSRCDGADELLNSFEEKVPKRIHFDTCEESASTFDDCDAPQIEINQGINNNGNNLIENCTGWVNIDLGSQNPNDFAFVWTNSEGDEFQSQSLDNIPLGIYTLIVSDQCCNQYEYTVSFCDTEISGPWYFNEEGLVCKEITCTFGDPSLRGNSDCDDLITTICQEYEVKDCSFNPKTKKCDSSVVVDGEETGLVISTDASFTDSFRKDQCIRTYTCKCENGDSDQSNQNEDAEFGDWDYEAENNRCFREIMCFGNTLDELDYVEDPDITYEDFDFDDELCIITVECQNIGGDLDDIEIEMTDPGDCELDDDECVKIVECENGEEIEVRDDAELEWEDWDLYEDCEGVIICFGEETDIEIETDPDVEWELIEDEMDSECAIFATCDGTVVFDEEVQATIKTWEDDGVVWCEAWCYDTPTGYEFECPNNQPRSKSECITKLSSTNNPTTGKFELLGLCDSQINIIDIIDERRGILVKRLRYLSNQCLQ